jgi:hydrogenase-4 component F
MHTWLPDAHSQAPTPVSALLSAVLLNCALYGILRFQAIVNVQLSDFTHALLILFGLVSIGIAAPFVLITKDYKRLLAYSSVEHVGIVALAVGIGSPLALFGGLLHVFNHAVAKSLMFFVAGNLNAKYGTRRIDAVRGALLALPFTGVALLVGFLAITGSPPFSIFVSEFTILNAAFAGGHYVAVALYLFFLLLVFAGFLTAMSRMAFGKPPPDMQRGEPSAWGTAAIALLLVFVVVLGVYLPGLFVALIDQASGVLAGVGA